MDLSKFIQIGSVWRSHGLNGVLKIKLKHFPLEGDAFSFKSLFIGKLPQPLPYFIEEFSHADQELFLVKLQDIDRREAAEKLSRQDIFVPQDVFEEYFEENPDEAYYAFLIGYTMKDANGEEVGTIEEVYEANMQEIAQLTYKGAEVLVPLAEENIILIDEAKEIIEMRLPDGLLELYTGQSE